MRSMGSPFVDKARLRAFIKVPLVEKLKNYSTRAETGYPE
jgi:hypothetical protein